MLRNAGIPVVDWTPHPTAGRGDGGRRGEGPMTASDATDRRRRPDGATARFVRRPAITSSVVALLPAALPWRSSPTRPSSGRSFGLPSAAALAFDRCTTPFVTVGRPLRALGALIALGGGLVVLVAVGQAATQSPQVTHRVELLPGIVGMWTLSAALAPVRFRWSRALIDPGAGFVFLGVLVTG